MTDHKNTDENTTQEFSRDIYLRSWTSFGSKQRNLNELLILSKISNVLFPLTATSHLKTDLELLIMTFPRFVIDYKFNNNQNWKPYGSTALEGEE